MKIETDGVMSEKPAVPAGTAELKRNQRPLLRAALIVAAYLFAFILLDIFSQQFEELRGVVAWYPPAGLTYTLLLVFGMKFVPAVTIALLISSLFIYRMPQPTYLLFLWASIISLIYGGASAFLRHIIRFDWQLRKLRDVIWFVFTAVIVSALLAVLSVSSSALSGDIPSSEVLRAIFQWWIGETVGVLTVTPFLLIYVMPDLKRFAEGQPPRLPARRSFSRPTISAIGQVASIALTLYWVFGAPVLDEFHPMFLISLPLIWIALQRGFKGVSAAILALNSGVVLALWLFQFDISRLGELELLMIVNCIVGLLMGAVVTERKQAEATLRKGEEHIRLVTDNMQDLVVRTDLEGVILYASPSNKTVLGYELETLLGKSIYDHMHPEDIERVREFALASLQAQTAGKQEMRYRHADGHTLWLESTGAIIFDENGSPTGAVFSSRDITERKQAEQEIISLAKFPSENPGPVLRLNREGILIYANAASGALLSMWGCAVGGSVPQFWCDLAAQVLASMENKTVDIECDRTVYAMFITPVTEQGYVNLYGRDITERKRTEAERQALLEIMQGVAATDSLTELLELIRQSLAKVIYAENFFVVFHNKNSGMFEEVFAVDQYDPPMPPSKLEKSMISYVYRTGEPLLLTQEKFEDLVERGEAELVGTKPAIWMGAPLKTPNETIGVMVVQNYQDADCYSERDMEFLSSVGAQVAVAIERKRVSDKLEEERIVLRTLIDNLPDLIYVMDVQGRKLISNLADWRASGGKRMEDVIGKTDFETYPTELAKEFWALGKQVIDSGTAVFNREEPGLDAQGNPVIVLSSKVPLRDGQGKVIGLVGIGHDITERKRAEEEIKNQLEELQRWQNATLGRESRILDLKREVNELLGQASQPPRYPSAESQENKED